MHTIASIVLAILIAAGCSTSERIILTLDPSVAQVRTDEENVPTFDGISWRLGTSTSALRYPAILSGGLEIDEWAVFCWRDLPGVTGLVTSARLQWIETVSGIRGTAGPVISSTGSLGPENDFSLTTHVTGAHVSEDNIYSIAVTGGGVAGDRCGPALVYARSN
jgi:hypothetical protein